MMLVAACDKDGGSGQVNFDRSKMLQDLADQVILPSYSELKTQADGLNTALAAFEATPDSASLVALQNAFKETYIVWQDCAAFEFGPAMDVALRNSVNIFPTDTTQIEYNISLGGYDLATASNVDAKGFPAVDYLLFANDINTTVAAFQSADRMQYLQDVVGEIVQKITQVQSAWQNSYATTFVESDGNDVGSSLGLLVNQLNYQWELIKNPKIGIPLGKKSLGQALPEKVEAYYSGISAELAFRNAAAIERLYLGTNYTTGADATGLDEYIQAVGANYNGQPLDEAISGQLAAAVAAISAVPDPLSATVLSNPTIVDAAYIELQKTVVLLKTDMPSALGVLITYQDNDGD